MNIFLCSIFLSEYGVVVFLSVVNMIASAFYFSSVICIKTLESFHYNTVKLRFSNVSEFEQFGFRAENSR